MTPRVITFFLIVAVAAGGFTNRRMLVIHAFALTQASPELLDAGDEGPAARWFDDYFTVEPLDERTYAIGEPRYYQQNFSYLILGSERALLFDAGPGVRDIRPVAESLTDLPITFVPSHFHYDHLGNGTSFSSVAVIDLPYLRERAPNDELRPIRSEHLGFAEDFEIPTLTVTEWLAPRSTLSLGSRDLLVLHTPGHTEDSISLVDAANGMVFSGDFIYPGPLFAFLPNSSMGDYLLGTNEILAATPTGPRLLGAHRMEGPGVPELDIGDVEDLKASLEAIRAGTKSGEGVYPVEYEINDRLSLIAEPRWLQRWKR